MKKIGKVVLIVSAIFLCYAIILSIRVITGWNRGFHAPTGVWISEDLSMRLDFDDRLDEVSGVRGTMIKDGELTEIALLYTSATGECSIMTIEDVGKLSWRDINYIFGGFANHRLSDDKIYFSASSRKFKDYIFVREESTE